MRSHKQKELVNRAKELFAQARVGKRSSCDSSERTGTLWNCAEPSQRPINLCGTMENAVHQVLVTLKNSLKESIIRMPASPERIPSGARLLLSHGQGKPQTVGLPRG